MPYRRTDKSDSRRQRRTRVVRTPGKRRPSARHSRFSASGSEWNGDLQAIASAPRPFYTYLLLLIPNSYRLDHLLALESGADDCLAKPFNQDELSARLAIAGRILNIDDRLTEISGRCAPLCSTRCPSAWPPSTNTAF